ncbi:hypothetical protein BABINDRAFT_8199 [Babjeviella inositovora NRRL Y-12698]|uniref:Uncharacterized protein n=1 Tax=Babjeviella inositovora NRRL Y-12698 TaxID=984486 RepID=A0A1E3QQQ9_9ASCO|nr:uncharacterized protein BABINDRAFT_8199 [Babjeviella inositovora NRRL Y-12698]ODQ80019.1 hypothetical protein BABINDRAFT_8199 [Babjeviella inositovora NRRL Y-12698]
MESSEFEAFADSDMSDHFRIKKLSVFARETKDYGFLHEKAFIKASSIVTDIMLEHDMHRDEEIFDWACLPLLPLVRECIREISVKSRLIDPNVPPLPSNLRRLEIIHSGTYIPDKGAPPIQFPPSLQEFIFHRPWGPISVYAGLPSTLQKLELVGVLNFSIESFNGLKLPHLKDLRLVDISIEGFNELRLPNLKFLELLDIAGVTEINKLFEFPSLLETLALEWLNLCLWELNFHSFEQRQLPLALQKLSITMCPLKKFRVDTFSNCFKDLILHDTEIPSSEICMLKFPSSLVSLLVRDSWLTSLDFVSSLPGSLEILNLSRNSLGYLSPTDADTARSCRIRFPESLQVLNLAQNGSLFTLYSLSNVVLPPSLTDLNLTRTNMSSVEGLKNLPFLRFLSLELNNLVSVEGLGIPSTLIYLNLSRNNLVSVEELDIPPTLTCLDLRVNNLQLFSKKLPDSVTCIDLEYNRLRELVNFRIPVNCITLKLSANPLQKLQITNAYDPNLKLRDLRLNNVAITTLRDVSPLPQCLTRFEISCSHVFSLSEVSLPMRLNHLEATNNMITSLENVEFPPRLETLRLRKNQISSLANVHFPDGLLTLELGDNKITSLDNVKFPPLLETLHLWKNQISSLVNAYFPDSLLALDLNANNLTSIDTIQFPPRLNVLNLGKNLISAVNELHLPDSLEMLTLANQKYDTLLNRASTREKLPEESYTSERKGLTYLAGLSKLPSKLHRLELFHNGLSEQAIQHLDFPASLKRLIIHSNAFENYYGWKEGIRLAYPGVKLDWGM